MNHESYNTYREILRQPSTWKDIYQKLAESKAYSPEFFKKDYDEIILFGCGSSYNLSQSAAYFTRYVIDNVSILALPSSELLINTSLFIRNSKKYLVIGFSRSGETTESVEVLQKLKDNKNVDLFAFTCRDNSSFCNIANNSFTCRHAVEKSIVMTESFSSMLLAYFVIFSRFTGNNDIITDIEKLIGFVDEKIAEIVSFTDRYVKKCDFHSYFALGSGLNYGLAVEADLKMKEMSQIPCYSYHVYEFSHGPKSLLDERSLCIVLTPGKNLIKFESVLQEFLQLGTSMLIIGNKPAAIPSSKKLEVFLEMDIFKTDIVKSFINIPVFQLLAFFKTLKNGLNPDLPKNLSYTVKI